RKHFNRSFEWLCSPSVSETGDVLKRERVTGPKREVCTTLVASLLPCHDLTEERERERDGPMVRSSTTSCTVTHHQPLKKKLCHILQSTCLCHAAVAWRTSIPGVHVFRRG
ncbi:unnamed protein product, partial [Ectocarpus sp. 12 AP-2014]